MHRTTDVDARYAVTTNCGNSLAGWVFHKSQIGDDSPKSKSNLSPNPYEMTLSSTTEFVGPWQAFSWSDPVSGVASACGFAPYIDFGQFDSNQDIELVNKLAKRVRGTDLVPSVFLAQAGESIDMINHTTTLVAKSIIAAKRGNFKGAWDLLTNGGGALPKGAVKRFNESFTSGWLSMQYGWLPLYDDLGQACNAIASMRVNPVTREYNVQTLKPGVIHDNFGGLGPGRAVSYLKLKLIVTQSNFSPQLPSIWDASQVAWELLPYSFVFDWAYPVSDYLNARAFLEQMEGKVVRTVFNNGVVFGCSPRGAYSIGLNYRHRSIKLSRTVQSVSAYGSSIPLPSLDLSLGPKRLLNGLSLLYQAKKTPVSYR